MSPEPGARNRGPGTGGLARHRRQVPAGQRPLAGRGPGLYRQRRRDGGQPGLQLSATLDESYHWTETDVEHRQYSGGVLLDWTDATGSGRASGDAYQTNAAGYSREDATVSTWSTSGGGTVRDMNLRLRRGEHLHLRVLGRGPL